MRTYQLPCKPDRHKPAGFVLLLTRAPLSNQFSARNDGFCEMAKIALAEFFRVGRIEEKGSISKLLLRSGDPRRNNWAT